jgi:hypothetical protein
MSAWDLGRVKTPFPGKSVRSQDPFGFRKGCGLSTCSACLCKTPSDRRGSFFVPVRGRRWSATSASRSKAKLRVARLQAKFARRRKDALHEATTTEAGPRVGTGMRPCPDGTPTSVAIVAAKRQALLRETAPAARGDPLRRSASAQTDRSAGSRACDHGSARPVRWPGR